MQANPKVYVESSCFIEIAKHRIGTHDKLREQDVWLLRRLLIAAKNKRLRVYTSMLKLFGLGVHLPRDMVTLPTEYRQDELPLDAKEETI